MRTAVQAAVWSFTKTPTSPLGIPSNQPPSATTFLLVARPRATARGLWRDQRLLKIT